MVSVRPFVEKVFAKKGKILDDLFEHSFEPKKKNSFCTYHYIFVLNSNNFIE